MRILSGFLAVFLFLSGCGEVPEVPPVSVGDGGVTVIEAGGKTPFEVYDGAYSRLTAHHNKFRRSLEEPVNPLGILGSLDNIIQCLQKMRSVAQEPWASQIGGYVQKYVWIRNNVARNSYSGSDRDSIDRYEREVRIRFYPDKVQMLAELPGKRTQEPIETAPQAPVEKQTSVSVAEKVPPAEPPKGPSAPAFWIFYKAWEQAHSDLVAAYAAKKECKESYERVIEVLGSMKMSLSGESVERVPYFIYGYENVHKATAGFTRAPEGATEADALNELKVIAAQILRELDPDRK